MADRIDIENIGEDLYVLIARGHHDVHEFMRTVRAEGYDWPLGMPQHLYFRAVPTRNPNWTCAYVPAVKGSRGAYPVTHVQEAWDDDSYEAIVAKQSKETP